MPFSLNAANVPCSDGRHQCFAAPVPLESGAQDQRLWTGPSGRGTLPEAAERWGHAQVSRSNSPPVSMGLWGSTWSDAIFLFYSFTFSPRKFTLRPFAKHF